MSDRKTIYKIICDVHDGNMSQMRAVDLIMSLIDMKEEWWSQRNQIQGLQQDDED